MSARDEGRREVRRSYVQLQAGRFELGEKYREQLSMIPRVYPAALNYFMGRSFPRARERAGASPGNSTKRIAAIPAGSLLSYRVASFFFPSSSVSLLPLFVSSFFDP